MAFSATTRKAISAVASRAEAMYQWASVKAFDWLAAISLILGLVQQFCKPKTEDERRKLVKSLAAKCAMNGVAGCIEACMSGPRARKTRTKMKKKLGLKSEAEQDKRFFTSIMASNAEMDESAKAMHSAYANDETDDEDD